MSGEAEESMKTIGRTRTILTASVIALTCVSAAPSGAAATSGWRRCEPVTSSSPDMRRVRSFGVGCVRARRVARLWRTRTRYGPCVSTRECHAGRFTCARPAHAEYRYRVTCLHGPHGQQRVRWIVAGSLYD